VNIVYSHCNVNTDEETKRGYIGHWEACREETGKRGANLMLGALAQARNWELCAEKANDPFFHAVRKSDPQG
jgi:hypothetical protein